MHHLQVGIADCYSFTCNYYSLYHGGYWRSLNLPAPHLLVSHSFFIYLQGRLFQTDPTLTAQSMGTINRNCLRVKESMEPNKNDPV